MSSERTAFRAEVAEVERWWKVRHLIFSNSRSRDHVCRALALQRQSDPTLPQMSSRSVARSPYPIPPILSPRRRTPFSQNTLTDARLPTHTERTFSFVHSTVRVVTNGAQYRLDPVQVTQMAKYLETVYVSGWQSSSTASSTNEPGPDLAGAFASTTDLFTL